MSFSYKILTQRKINLPYFGDVNKSVNGYNTTLNFTFTLKVFNLKNYVIILIFFFSIAFLFAFHPCKFCKLCSITL